MLRLKSKKLYKLAGKLLDKTPDCPACKGSGFKIEQKKIDNITYMDETSPCPVCDQYGHYPIPWYIFWFIKIVEQ